MKQSIYYDRKETCHEIQALYLLFAIVDVKHYNLYTIGYEGYSGLNEMRSFTCTVTDKVE